jgi:hypothetical protein
MSLVDFNFTPSKTPAIVFDYGCENLGDNPHLHRWRAWWDCGMNEEITNIRLSAYPVIKLTAQGAWIDPVPSMSNAPGRLSGLKRIVFNGCRASWAKETQDNAIRSLAVRMSIWSNHIATNRRKAIEAASVLEILRPDLPSYVQNVRGNLE